jgi:hypothetical protein
VFLTDTLYFICIDKHIGMTNVKMKLKQPVLSELGSNLFTSVLYLFTFVFGRFKVTQSDPNQEQKSEDATT